MLSLKKTLSICVTLSGVIILNAKEINVPKTLQPPVIDGKSSDKCWDAVQWNSGFNLLGHKKTKAPVKTKFKFLHDNNYLYLLVVADEPSVDKLKAKAKKRDGHVFSDDSIELFINANDDNTTYHQFIVNTLGIFYDSERMQGGALNYPQWNSKLKATTRIGKDKWVLELAIPIVDLNVNSTKWHFNIGRNRTIGSQWRTYTFSGLFTQPDTFATLNFVDADFNKYNIDIKSFYDKKTIIRNGKAYFTAKTFIQNNTGKMLFIKVDTGLSKGGKFQTRKGISSGNGQEIIINIPVNKEGSQQACIKVYDYRKGELLAKMEREVKIKVIALEIKLSKPVYRNNIYATQKLNDIAGNIVACLEDKTLENISLILTLSSKEHKIIASAKIKKVSKNNKFSFPIKELKLGSYILDAKLLKNGKVLYSNSTIINKLPKVANEYRLVKNGNVLYNGKFFMPYGWFCIKTKEEWKQEKKEGLNILVEYGAYFKTDAQLKEWLNAAHQIGMKVIIRPYPKRFMVNHEEFIKPLSDSDTIAIRKFVNKWKKYPALAAWYLGDEIENKVALPARMKAIYQIVSNADPYHPAIILDNTVTGLYKYADYCDILMADPYPLFAKDGYAIRKMEYISKFTAAIENHKGKGHWMTPQGFSYGDFKAANNRAPNFTELRCQQYQVIIGGATGIIWWAHRFTKKYPACIYGVRFLAKEAKLLETVVEQNPRRTMLKTSDKLLMAALYKNVNGHDYIIAVNTKVATLNTKIFLPVNKTWYVMSENRKIKSNGKFLEDKFGIYDVHIYTTNKDIANKLSIAKIKQKIKKMEK
jgi:cellulose/xylan binding protein with CBM9 domain